MAKPRTTDGVGRTKPGHRRRKLLRYIVIALAIVFAALATVTARWFAWPPQERMPTHVDAIVMLNGPGDRLDSALDLAWAHRAPMIVIARGSRYWGHGSVCAPKVPQVKVICFDPEPATTRGEAEFAGRLASQYRWHSIVVVAIAPQDIVARMRAERCFKGRIYVLNASLAAYRWPYEITHEWGSTVKALFLQRSC